MSVTGVTAVAVKPARPGRPVRGHDVHGGRDPAHALAEEHRIDLGSAGISAIERQRGRFQHGDQDLRVFHPLGRSASG